MNFSDLPNDVAYNFYGVDNHFFKLGGQIFEAVEDESDGYRSYLQSIEICDRKDLIFQRLPIAQVTIHEVDDTECSSGFKLVDIEDGHVWLEVGTDHRDDYYPTFKFDYDPKAPKY